jgi:hypothetical protein
MRAAQQAQYERDSYQGMPSTMPWAPPREERLPGLGSGISKAPPRQAHRFATNAPDPGGYQGHIPRFSAWRYSIAMSTGTGSAKYRCAQCEMPESQCECDKFCCLCQTVLEVRLCQDGLLYCEPCRAACDYKTSD